MVLRAQAHWLMQGLKSRRLQLPPQSHQVCPLLICCLWYRIEETTLFCPCRINSAYVVVLAFIMTPGSQRGIQRMPLRLSRRTKTSIELTVYQVPEQALIDVDY